MPLVILGAIVVIGAFLLIHSNFSTSGRARRKEAGSFRTPGSDSREKPHETPADGKVIFLFEGGKDVKKDGVWIVEELPNAADGPRGETVAEPARETVHGKPGEPKKPSGHGEPGGGEQDE
jgi:hypothetical protein